MATQKPKKRNTKSGSRKSGATKTGPTASSSTVKDASAPTTSTPPTKKPVEAKVEAGATPASGSAPASAVTEVPQPYRLEGTDRVELLIEAQAKARNLARSDGKKWLFDPSAADKAKPITLPPAGEVRKKLQIEGARKEHEQRRKEAIERGKVKPNQPQGKAKRREGLSGLDAAAQVLKEAGQPMRCGQIVETMLGKGLWKTKGQTPAATIYAAILREIQAKGAQARFKKTDRGLFTVTAGVRQ